MLYFTAAWRCPNCHDVMHHEARRSHEAICAWVSEALSDAVDRIVEGP